MKGNIIIISVIAVILVSCKPKLNEAEMNPGEMDVTRYVSIGGSSSAGYMDDAMSFYGQENSFNAIIAVQLEKVGATGYTQPFFLSGSVGVNFDGLSSFTLGYKTDCLGATSLSPVRKASQGDLSTLSSNIYTSPFRNMGVPNLKTTEVSLVGYGNPANGAGNYNPFFARMCSNQATSSVLSDIVSQQATVFTVFLGFDEVLAYAKKGASIGSLTPVNGAPGVGFEGSYEQLLTAVTQNGAKGAVSTIPDVTELPYFTTIPYNGLNLDEAGAETLNQIYNPIGLFFNVGANPFVIEDPSAGTFGVRKMEPGEKILLSVPLDSVKCNKMGSLFPFRNEFILTNTEIAEIQTATNQYNAIITAKAAEKGLALVDAKTFYSKLKAGIVYNGIAMDARFVSGGAFSLDGITLNPRGNALFANTFIEAMNKKYNAKIPFAAVSKYNGVIFP
jgi:hypothetical protein